MIKRMQFLALCALMMFVTATSPLQAQGKGNDKAQQQGKDQGGKGKAGKGGDRPQQNAKAHDQGRGNDKARASGKGNSGNGNAARDDSRETRGNSGSHDGVSKNNGNGRSGGKFKRVIRVNDLTPSLQRFATSNRAPHKIAAGAVGRGFARGLKNDDIVLRENGDRLLLLNRSGAVLVDLDDERARNLGRWNVRPYNDDVKSGAPAFCRSGEGHPVWGREWCLEKGFGLGDYRDVRWGRTADVGDIIFRQEVDRATLARDVLIGVLGDVVLNRLGLHAVTLGYADPLQGVWLGETTGPRVLRLTSGGVPIAEIYDGNRDNRADAMVVALRTW